MRDALRSVESEKLRTNRDMLDCSRGSVRSVNVVIAFEFDYNGHARYSGTYCERPLPRAVSTLSTR